MCSAQPEALMRFGKIGSKLHGLSGQADGFAALFGA